MKSEKHLLTEGFKPHDWHDHIQTDSWLFISECCLWKCEQLQICYKSRVIREKQKFWCSSLRLTTRAGAKHKRDDSRHVLHLISSKNIKLMQNEPESSPICTFFLLTNENVFWTSLRRCAFGVVFLLCTLIIERHKLGNIFNSQLIAARSYSLSADPFLFIAWFFLLTRSERCVALQICWIGADVCWKQFCRCLVKNVQWVKLALLRLICYPSAGGVPFVCTVLWVRPSPDCRDRASSSHVLLQCIPCCLFVCLICKGGHSGSHFGPV